MSLNFPFWSSYNVQFYNLNWLYVVCGISLHKIACVNLDSCSFIIIGYTNWSFVFTLFSCCIFISGYDDQQIANLVDYFDEALTQAGVDVGAIENEWLKMKDQTYCRYFSFHSTCL